MLLSPPCYRGENWCLEPRSRAAGNGRARRQTQACVGALPYCVTPFLHVPHTNAQVHACHVRRDTPREGLSSPHPSCAHKHACLPSSGLRRTNPCTQVHSDTNTDFTSRLARIHMCTPPCKQTSASKRAKHANARVSSPSSMEYTHTHTSPGRCAHTQRHTPCAHVVVFTHAHALVQTRGNTMDILEGTFVHTRVPGQTGPPRREQGTWGLSHEAQAGHSGAGR